MIKLDDNFLQELGLGELPQEEKKAMLKHIYETLEVRVGMKLAEKMSEAQLSEFEGLMPKQTDSPEEIKQKEQSALVWLETNFPNYKTVVSEELAKLQQEVKNTAPQILQASQQHQNNSSQ